MVQAIARAAVSVFVAAGLLWPAALFAAGEAVVADHIAAAVNREIITAGELRRTMELNRALGGAEDPGAAAETLDGIINRRLLVDEANRLKIAEVSEEEAAAEVEKFKGRIGSASAFAALLARLEMTEGELAALLAERLLVERFIEKKISLFARIGRDEAERYFREHPEEFRGLRFSEAQARISALLARRKANQQLDLYLADLRKRADIRINPLTPADTGLRQAGSATSSR